MKRCIAMLVMTLVPSAVCAQETVQSWPGVAGLSTVYVLDDTGVETSGRLLRLNLDSLVLLVDGTERRFGAAHVRRIQTRGDSLRNGALIGAVAGAVTGLLSGGLADCPGDNPGGSCAATRAALLLFSTGVYAAIGTGIDALVAGRTTLYQAPAVPRAANREGAFQSPHGRRAAVDLTIRW